MSKNDPTSKPENPDGSSLIDPSVRYLSLEVCKRYVLGTLSEEDKAKVEELLAADEINQHLLRGVKGHIEQKGIKAFEKYLKDDTPVKEFLAWLDEFGD